jgi:hypothetical protein
MVQRPEPAVGVADRMPGAVWHSVEGAGHFVAVGSGDELFGIAAEELGSMHPKSPDPRPWPRHSASTARRPINKKRYLLGHAAPEFR